ncbi:MAG: glutamine-hydrolyzing carbamoyl-phosphate synthase small subunit [Bacillota bacterium]
MNARLVLEDGSIFYGSAFGYPVHAEGEVVFNTSMTGYQEILTDPSYCGQIVSMTYPLIGNYGVNEDDYESARPYCRGLVVHELCALPSNWRAYTTLENFMIRYKLSGIQGIDTRALTKILRKSGTMRGLINADSDETDAELVEKAKKIPCLSGQDFVRQVTSPEIIQYNSNGSGPKVALIDFGAKINIIRSLSGMGCRVTSVPCTLQADEILKLKPDGIMLSNGPGDPKDVMFAVDTVKNLMGEVPLFGICLGHQVIGLALGGDTYKLKYGHRGANHPVKDLNTGKVYITSQNHGFAVKTESLDAETIAVSHINLNDGTVEGIRHRKLPVFSVQYHPEASPGPLESSYLFHEFLCMMQ